MTWDLWGYDLHTAGANGDLPEGLTFHYHPTDDTIRGTAFYAPAVEARLGGRRVGHLAWDGADRFGNVSGKINDIRVHKDLRRHGIATAMMDFARQYEPKVRHSNELSPAGEQWMAYETSRHRTAMPTLYRGLQHEFDPDRPAIPIGAPNGYSHWTDSPDIARQWAGPEGHVYSYDLPDEAMGSKWLNENADGKTPLYFDNGPLIGRPGAPKLKGREYLVYNDHDDYDPTQIKPYKKANHMTAAVTVYTKDEVR